MNRRVLRDIVTVLWVIALVIFQTTLCRYIDIMGIMPDLIFVFLMAVSALELKYSRCIVLAAVIGMIIDMLSSRGFGVNTLFYCYAVSLCCGLGEHFFKKKIFFAVPLTFAACIVFETLFFMLGFGIFDINAVGRAFLSVVLPEAVYNTVLVFPMYKLVKITLYKTENNA